MSTLLFFLIKKIYMENLNIGTFIKGGKFMDDMREMRKKRENGKYDLTLEIGDSAYFGTYEDVDLKSGEDLVRNYLRSNSDDADFKDIKINYNKNRHTVRVTAELDYFNREHKDYSNRGKLM